jgi:hypothetical protein
MEKLAIRIGEAICRVERVIGRFWLKHQLWSLPPHPKQANLSEVDQICVVMGCRRTLPQTLLTAYSWRRNLPSDVSMVLCFDGDVAPDAKRISNRLFGDSVPFLNANHFNQQWQNTHIGNFVRFHRFGRKFGAIYHFSKSHSVIYSDDDILVFRTPNELLSLKNSRFAHAYSPDSSNIAYNVHPQIIARAEELSRFPLKNYQAGLMFVKKQAICDTILNQLLKGWHPFNDVHFAEQSLFSVLFADTDVLQLPIDTYINDPSLDRMPWENRGNNDWQNAVLRHYMGTVRHNFFRTAKHLLKEYRKS